MAVLRWFTFLLVVAVLAGCSSAGRDAGTPTSGASSSGAFTTTDVAWLQLSDALHARALPLLELAPRRAASRSLAGLAVRLGEAHEAGRGRLRALLAEAGITGENPHTRHDMPGMPTAEDLKSLAGLRDGAFDRRFAELLRAHLGQLVLVANGERDSGGAAAARELAETMAREHADDLAELDRAVAA
ncbi:uncharacterized protein (DUF305 family) [Nonomuraea thailandensis]|uniref:Uncharacterized protein (DUF305 family) n=1 Tax=Nonomuraea thailandensis TaxID=1188745 RepID=A0A9X2H252_9ACTN|nr:DUF305 domain-containing protein [Nonomuraea thailandensis]MCP2364588.1 uncharacterized protein (DUF305 family) [Nonomuraea thailandensis]